MKLTRTSAGIYNGTTTTVFDGSMEQHDFTITNRTTWGEGVKGWIVESTHKGFPVHMADDTVYETLGEAKISIGVAVWGYNEDYNRYLQVRG